MNTPIRLIETTRTLSTNCKDSNLNAHWTLKHPDAGFNHGQQQTAKKGGRMKLVGGYVGDEILNGASASRKKTFIVNRNLKVIVL